jgi:hypothetical protein
MPTVASVTPADGTAAVQGGTPVRVELKRLDSTDYIKVETSQADFSAGTLVNVQVRATNDLALAFNDNLIDNFEGDTIGSVPTGWVTRSGANMTVQSKDSQKSLKAYSSTADVALWNAEGALGDVEILCDINEGDGVPQGAPGIIARANNSGALNCYMLYADKVNSVLQLFKCVSGTFTLITSVGKTLAYSTWYTMRFKLIGTAIQGRIWQRGTSEPGTWDINTTDSTYSSGYIGVRKEVATNNTAWFDNFTVVGGGTGDYSTSGSRISPAYALSGVGTFGTGIVQYDSTVPANTTLVLKISKDGTNWTTVANGDHIALWSEGDDLASASIYTKAELATTDTAVTPVLSEVRLIFMAMDPALVEINVGGTSYTVANGKLLVWNTRKYASLVLVDPCYQDVFFETIGSWWDDYGPEQITVLVKYNGVALSTTTFNTDTIVAWMPCGLESWWWASAIGGVYDGPMWGTCYYMASKLEDYLVRGDVHWYVQFPPSTTYDAWYLIAHAFRSDTPLAGIVGQPVAHDVPASGVGNCWARCDTPATGITQSWMRNDHAAAGVVAVVMPPHDEALSGIVGKPLAKDTAAAGVVYEVNANNGIDLRVISVEEAAFLAALGIDFR